MPTKYPRAGRTSADLTRPDAADVPLGTYFWESKPSTSEFTRISLTRRKDRHASTINDMIDDEIRDFEWPEGTATRDRHDTTRAPTEEV